ncbi:MAG: MotA/TolQ/ExbB proton channel family protein [Candidatus Hydrogenedentes bacterium]|nr:MotA/TolQ/ExbB proton channel family protein [Candidatus Hydrogenedentota bacterium]
MPQNWDVWYIIQQGGPVMWPIMFCSIVVMAISIERFFTLRRAQIDTRDFMDTMRTTLRQNRIQEALDTCEVTKGPISRIVKAGLLKHTRSKADIREAIEDAGRIEVPVLERRLSALATCASVAPLLGLLGTVQGMIVCFAQIRYKQGQVSPGDLAEGIANALITTAAGLVIAIPALVLYNYFVSRVDNLVLEMEVSSSELVELLTKDRDGYEA